MSAIPTITENQRRLETSAAEANGTLKNTTHQARLQHLTRVPWWLAPHWLILFVLLPIFLLCVYLADYILPTLRVYHNALTESTVFFGTISLLALCLGGLLSHRFVHKSDTEVSISTLLLCARLTAAGAFISYAVFFSPIATNFGLLLEFLRGSSTIRFRYILTQIPGLTSLMQLGIVYLCIYASLRRLLPGPLPSDLRYMQYAILFLTFTRAMLFSERLALIEASVVLAIYFSAWHWKPSAIRLLAPFIAIVGLFVTFAFFEYFRSWQFYQYYYPSFFDFISYRFLGYFVTSINNGAGIMVNYGPLNFPYVSGAWFTKLPILAEFFKDIDQFDFLLYYLTRLGSLEFNNPGGAYVLLFEYGVPVGLLLMLATGVFTGIVFGSFRRGNLLGTLLYPAWFVGVLDIIRIYYWGETRFFPIVLACVAVSFACRRLPNKVDTSQLPGVQEN